MALLSGAASFSRFNVHDEMPEGWRALFREALTSHAFVPPTTPVWKGERMGWCQHDNLFDTSFEEDHWLLDPWIVLGFRLDRKTIPNKELKARLALRVAAWCKETNAKVAPKGVKTELREALELEMAPKTATRRTVVEILWNTHDGTVWVGTSSESACDKIRQLFRKTFGEDSVGLVLARHNPLWRLDLTSAQILALVTSANLGRDEGGETPDEPIQTDLFDLPPFVAGPELLAWIWWRSSEFDAVAGLEVFVDQRAELVSPQVDANRVTVRGEKTSRAPEAFVSMQRGKLPRALQIVIREGDHEANLVLDRNLAVTGAKLPSPFTETDDDKLYARADELATLDERIGALFKSYAEVRLDSNWPNTLASMRAWVRDGDSQ